MEATYYKDTMRSYMIIECPPEAETTGYQYRMLEMNRIEGLLSCGTRHIDGERFLYYDVTGKQSLMALYESRKIPGTELFKILKAVDQVSGSMSKYLLDEQHLVLDEEQIFYDFQTGSYCFTYYPGKITEPGVFRFLADGIDGTDKNAAAAATDSVLWQEEADRRCGKLFVRRCRRNRIRRCSSRHPGSRPYRSGNMEEPRNRGRTGIRRVSPMKCAKGQDRFLADGKKKGPKRREKEKIAKEKMRKA